ncbi:hypothetical protein AB0M94_03470 [Streptomyces xanthochromogenes]|uniref:Secreted protein n=1 Tax=Streptomyces xanthochromogenes TaxID=67384 RepID=A0ABQ2ZNB8_9ACTN|nr:MULTISPECIES: hypothetical protein [Streptomyces]MYV95499.1 hypothetical protein [Streptomyces sp. SID1034]GGY18144.1 hypothetical protein GCM10010326_08390 [Streptomyces xanthochromogenes]
MTPFLDWLGSVPAAVSAVHALAVLLQRGRRNRRRPLTAQGGCGAPSATVVRVEGGTGAAVTVTVRFVPPLAAPAAGGAQPAAEGRGRW